MPGRGLLVCVSDSQERFLVERPSPDLEPDRQSIAGEPAGNRDRRKRRESIGAGVGVSRDDGECPARASLPWDMLASAEAAFVNGAAIVIDGGATAR